MNYLREKVLEEINRRLADVAYVCTKCSYVGPSERHDACGYAAQEVYAREKQALRALKRGVERHTAEEDEYGIVCNCCGLDWPCPIITATAEELGVTNG